MASPSHQGAGVSLVWVYSRMQAGCGASGSGWVWVCEALFPDQPGNPINRLHHISKRDCPNREPRYFFRKWRQQSNAIVGEDAKIVSLERSSLRILKHCSYQSRPMRLDSIPNQTHPSRLAPVMQESKCCIQSFCDHNPRHSSCQHPCRIIEYGLHWMNRVL
jgi:hypothetical protein